MIKVIIFDGEGTLQLPNPSEEIRSLVTLLPQMDIIMAVASNGSRSEVETRFNLSGLPLPKIIVTPSDLGLNRAGKYFKKPSPEFVYQIRNIAQVALNEIMYVGDDDNTDALCAINAGVLPLTAKYSTSTKPKEYGFPISTPGNLVDYIKKFAKQDTPYFGWVFQDDSLSVDIRALFGDQGELKEKRLNQYSKIK